MLTAGIVLVVALYTALPFLTGTSLFNQDVPGDDAEVLARVISLELWKPYRYYGHYLYLIFTPQLYYYLTPAFSMIPAFFMGRQRWFITWALVLFGSLGYTHHMLMSSFLPIINYMVFIPLNLFLLSKGRYRWLIASMFVSLMFHGSSGIIIQVGTGLCMLTRLSRQDWLKVMPLVAVVIMIYVANHLAAPSAASRVIAATLPGTTAVAEDSRYFPNYLGVIRQNGMLARWGWSDHLAANWFFYYLGLPAIPALAVVALKRTNQYVRWLSCFTVLPLGIIIIWFSVPGIRPAAFNMLDRASSALSIITLMAAGLAAWDVYRGRRVAFPES